MKTANLKQVIEIAKKNNGITYSLALGQINPKFGYMVSKENSEFKSDKLDKQTLASYLKAQAEALAVPENYLGLWYDDNSGFWYFGISTIILDLENAFILATENKQLAIYDNKYEKVLTTIKIVDSQKEIMDCIVQSIPKVFIKGKGITILPTPQKAGTNFQAQTYARLKAGEIWNGL